MPAKLLSAPTKKLESIGFEPPVLDQCLLISSYKVVCLVYVDDTLFFAENDDGITKAINGLIAAGMDSKWKTSQDSLESKLIVEKMAPSI
jgi:hypothetical protein